MRQVQTLFKVLVFLVLLPLGFAQTPACSTTYAGGGSSGSGVGPVFSINTSTGARVTTLFTPPVQTSAFARDAKTNRLYYIQNTTGNAAWGYYDLSANTTVPLGTFPKSGGDTGSVLRFGFNNQGVGYASISTNNAVYKITPAGTGSSTTAVERLGVVSDLPTGLSGDFAVTAANRAWLVTGGRVFRIRLDTLTSVEVVNTDTAAINGVAFETSGNLLLSDTTTVYRLNTATLDFTTVGAVGGTLASGDLGNCVVPALEPNLSVVKTVSPSGSVAPGSVLTYTITTTNTGNAVSVNTTFTDAIPANTTYVTGSTTLNGTAVPDATGGVMPYVAGGLVKSPANGTAVYRDGIVSTTAPAVVTFQVRVANPVPSTVAAITNQGFVGYDSGVSETTITVPSAPTAGGSGATSTPVGNRDFGDAPDAATGTGVGNYQTTGADNGPSHTIVSGLRLGSVVADADDGTLQNAAATADNLTGTNDEDGVTNFPAILASAAATQVITVPVGVTNTTGAAATLTGYLDFNKDGDFLDLGEQSASVSVAAGATSASVIFSAPAGLTAGTTYARFRIGSTASEVASSVGAASSGEVEDYLVTIGSPDLTISKTHIGSFVRGSTGTYTLTVRNTGDQPTAGTITVTDTLPAGLSVNNGSAGTVVTGGTNAANWTCTSNAASPQSITCTSTAVIATGGNSVFTLGVNVAAGAGTPVINNVAVSGGGEVAANNGNNTSSDSAVTAAPTDLTLTKSHSGSFTVGSTGTYNFTVNNIGGVASSGAITVTDTLPTGLTFVTGSTTGTGWSCSASGQTVTCISSTAVGAAGNSTFSFNVNVGAATAPGTNSITNTASVSGGGDSNPANNSANNGNGDPTTVLSPDLTVSKTHTGNFTRGSTGIYTLTVGNSGTVSTSGTLTLTDTLPAGLSVNGGAVGAVTTGGTNAANWSCTANAASPQVITCSSTTSIAISGSSTFTLSVNVAAGAGSSVTNSVSVSGGNEATARNGNNSATDPTMTVAPTDLTLSKTHSGNFTVGQPGSYSFTVTNIGGVASSGTMTVTDTLPTGLTFVNGSATGAGWSCSASGQTVTCSSSAAISAAANSTFSFDVNVGVATAPGTNSITNTAAVSGGGDSNAANNGAADPTTVLSPDLTVSKSHTPASFVQGGVGNYLIRVYNNTNSSAAPTSGPVTVTDTLPNGLSVPTGAVTLTAGKTVWSCTAAGQTASGQVITCTYTKTVAAGSGSNVGFNVNVASPAPASVTNEVMVSGGNEATANTGNNTYSDPTPTVDAGSLTLVKSVRNVTKNSPFSSAGSGEPGDVLEYCIAYSNPGQSPVSVATIRDTVPTFTVVQTNVLGYGGAAIRWRVTLPSASTQNLSADADSDAGEISGNILTTRLDIVPAGGAGDVCFQAGIE